LHDRIGQPLLVLKMMIGSLRKSINMPDLASSISEMETLLGRTIQDARSLTFELSPQVLYILGFEAAIEWLAEQNEKRYAINFEFQSDRKCRPLNTDLEVFLFQAVKELLSNIGKHSGASKASITISSDEEEMSVKVEDNGVGFDVFSIDHFKDGDKGFGLFSIRERLYHLGGNMRMVSKPNQGTKITLNAPLEIVDKAGNREVASA
jgi:signal transduction histidine kinase